MVSKYLHDNFAVKSDQVSPMRVYGLKRDAMVALFKDFGFKKGAEVGTQRGLFAEIMCKAIPELDLTCVDPWAIVPDCHRTRQVGQAEADNFYEEAKERLKPYNCKIIRTVSLDAVKDIPWESLDFVYIDGSHEFDYVMTDLIEWSKRVKSGGIVCGHDYYRFHHAGVVQAVDLYTHMHKIDEWFLTDERTPSFFWSKP